MKKIVFYLDNDRDVRQMRAVVKQRGVLPPLLRARVGSGNRAISRSFSLREGTMREIEALRGENSLSAVMDTLAVLGLAVLKAGDVPLEGVRDNEQGVV